MGKIVNIKQAIKVSKKLRREGKSIVLAGGCFDIIHVGHVMFLNSARKRGHVLFVLLESDAKVKRLKGDNRPINNQQNRALVLSAMSSVDFVVMLPELEKDSEYDAIITKIHPSIIATTTNDSSINHKKRQARLINGKVVYVTKRIYNQSTTKLSILTKETGL